MPVVLITGANRGIGFEFAKRFAAKKYTVLCLVRDPSKMPKLDGDVRTVKYSADSRTGATEAIEALKSHGVEHIDVAIGNAGICPNKDSLLELDPDVFENILTTNVTSVLLLFQAVKPLLTPSPGSPSPTSQFIAISSSAGVINADLGPWILGGYGLSKAAVNFLVRKLHFDHPELVIYSFSPGWLPTEMGNTGAGWFGYEKAPDDLNVMSRLLEPSASMIEVIETCDKDKQLGGYMNNWSVFGARRRSVVIQGPKRSLTRVMVPSYRDGKRMDF